MNTRSNRGQRAQQQQQQKEVDVKAKKQRKGSAKSWWQFISFFDTFGSPIALNYGKEEGGEYHTGCGALCSILVLTMSLFFFCVFIFAVQGYKGTIVTTSTETDYFELEQTFGAQDGFKIAFSAYSPFNQQGKASQYYDYQVFLEGYKINEEGEFGDYFL